MMNDLSSVHVFWSHRYKSPEFNLYFFKLFSEFGEIQFDLDAGEGPTCVTRLERSIRNSDAFVGVYPIPELNGQIPSPAQLRKASQYFRLELDIAVRAGKPSVVFFDQQYGRLLKCPPSIRAYPFNSLEIQASGGKPSIEIHRRIAREFMAEVKAFIQFQSLRPIVPPVVNDVAVILPDSETPYGQEERRIIRSELAEYGYQIVDCVAPQELSLLLHSKLQQVEWVVTDIGAPFVETGIPSYLHGQCIPMLRLLCTSNEKASPFESTLFGNFETGYPKDIVRWHDAKMLKAGIHDRIVSLQVPLKRMNLLAEALEYFSSAALRQERVFLSYAGEDCSLAEEVSIELKKRFQTVFDYRDGYSIPTGRPWIEEIHNRLAKSPIAIPLLSPAYFASGNCKRELRQIFAAVDEGKTIALPVKIRRDHLDLPEFIQAEQYARFWEKRSAAQLVDDLIRDYDRRLTENGASARS